MTFLPKDFTGIPTTSNYMKFDQGANKIRILGSAITGFEWWVEDSEGRRPHRAKKFEDAVSQGVEPIKYFWAFPVWNYKTSRVQILEVTQKSIMRAIENHTQNEDWGDPKDYDFTITRDGSGMETDYSVIASPKKPVLNEATEAFKSIKIDLTALYRGEDPFKSETTEEEASQVAEDVVEALQ